MTTLAFGSVRGAPGVTTTALLVAAALPEAVLIEADLAGGVLAARYGLGREPGLTTLAASARNGVPLDWRDHAQSAGGVPTIVGPDSAEIAHALWHRAGDRVAAILGRLGVPVVVDLGRIGSTVPLSGALDLAVVVLAPTSEHLLSANHRLEGLRSAARAVGIVVVGTGPYRSSQVAEALGSDLLGVLPADDRAARMLVDGAGSARAFARTRLARAAQLLAESVTGVLNGLSLQEVRR